MFKKFKMSFTTQIIIASILGLLVGSFAGPWVKNIEFIGKIWLRLIQMSIIALIMSSVAGAIGNIEGSGAGKISFHTFKYIIIFTIFSALLGLALAFIIKPGAGIDLGAGGNINGTDLANMSITDTITNMVPSNIFQAMSEGATVQTIIFALIFGVQAGVYSRKSGRENVLLLIKDIYGIIIEMIGFAMKFAPIGIFALLAPVAGTTGLEVIIPMMKFLFALLVADIIMFLVYFPITAALVGVSPLKMPKKFAKMSIMALTTTSGAICLPTKMEDSVTKFGISKRVTDFTGPITMSMNSSGAVACYVLAIMFMAQSSNTIMSPTEIFTGVLLAIMMVMGTIVVPGGSVVVYTFFATALGLPFESIAILISIDWFAGMFRTIMNVTIDVLVGMLVAKKLDEFDADVYNEKKTVEYID